MLVRRKLIQLSSVLVMFALVVFYFLSILTSRRDSSEYGEHDRGHSIMSPGEGEVITTTVDHSAGLACSNMKLAGGMEAMLQSWHRTK